MLQSQRWKDRLHVSKGSLGGLDTADVDFVDFTDFVDFAEDVEAVCAAVDVDFVDFTDSVDFTDCVDFAGADSNTWMGLWPPCPETISMLSAAHIMRNVSRTVKEEKVPGIRTFVA